MTFSLMPGEIRDFKMASGEGLDREGLILKISGTTDPRVTKITVSGDTIFGIGFSDTDDIEGTVATGGKVGVIQDGEAMVAVAANTYYVGDAIYNSDSVDGQGVKTSVGSQVGICQEYKVVSSAQVTAGTNQLRVRLTFTT